MLCTSKGCTEGRQREENAYETTTSPPPRQINSALFPWQRGTLIWWLVSHGCVSLPHRPPLCLTDGSCDCNHPSYCQKKKKGQERGNHIHHLTPAPLCPANKPPCCEQSQHIWLNFLLEHWAQRLFIRTIHRFQQKTDFFFLFSVNRTLSYIPASSHQNQTADPHPWNFQNSCDWLRWTAGSAWFAVKYRTIVSV